jgi:ppGpp synthetase/RelA/SpoT-type nucleotidyltranferase
MNILFSMLKANHADDWYPALECMNLNLRNVKFGETVVIGDSYWNGNPINEKDERNLFLASESKVQELRAFEGCRVTKKFEKEWVRDDEQAQIDYLNNFVDALKKRKAKSNTLFLTIASGNRRRREPMLVLARIFGARIFHRFNPESKHTNNDLYEIPPSQIDAMVAQILKGRKLKAYRDCAAAKSAGKDFIRILIESDLGASPFLHYWGRWDSLIKDLDDRKQAFENMITQTVDLLSKNILTKNHFIFKPEFKFRVKDKTSVWNKLLKKEGENGYIGDPFLRFTDFAGVRIVFFNMLDLKKGIDLIKKSGHFVNVDGDGAIKVDNRIRALGYRAFHLDVKLHPDKYASDFPDLLDVPCEIQIKTTFADAWSDIHHKMTYKDVRRTPLTEKQRDNLDSEFRKAAGFLEGVDDVIAKLSDQFDPRK